jgi:hypothetical protein
LKSNPSGNEHGDYDEQGSEKEDEENSHENSEDNPEEPGKPVKLNIESRPPEKSPYEKIFNVIL